MVVIEEGQLAPDERYGGFIELSVQGHGSVVCHPSPRTFPEVVLEVFGGGPDTLHVIGKTAKGGLSGGAMGASVVDVAYPAVDGFIELMEGCSLEARKELGLNGSKQPLDFSPSLRLIRFGVDECHAQGGCDFAKVSGAEGRAVVHIEFSRESSFEERLS